MAKDRLPLFVYAQTAHTAAGNTVSHPRKPDTRLPSYF